MRCTCATGIQPRSSKDRHLRKGGIGVCLTCFNYVWLFGLCKGVGSKANELDVKGVKCLVLGYYKGTKVYRLICLMTKKIIKSLDVVFF